MKLIVMTGPPRRVNVGAITFVRGEPTPVPDALAEELLLRPHYRLHQPDPVPAEAPAEDDAPPPAPVDAPELD